MRPNLTVLALLTVLCGGVTSAVAGSSIDPDCAVEKYAGYAAAQARWQRDLTRLVVATCPQYTEVANRYMEDQLARIELRRIAVAFLARQRPATLDTTAPINQWLSLDPATEKEIAGGDERYAKLLQQQEQARARPPHPDGDALRTAMREKIMPKPAYRALAARLSAAVEQVEAIACE
ncbi:MAG: hypothetical protein PVG98_00635 [Chromatiales bacterium]|jgi:hypothetical protein